MTNRLYHKIALWLTENGLMGYHWAMVHSLGTPGLGCSYALENCPTFTRKKIYLL